jgi:hypothetical protein
MALFIYSVAAIAFIAFVIYRMLGDFTPPTEKIDKEIIAPIREYYKSVFLQMGFQWTEHDWSYFRNINKDGLPKNVHIFRLSVAKIKDANLYGIFIQIVFHSDTEVMFFDWSWADQTEWQKYFQFIGLRDLEAKSHYFRDNILTPLHYLLAPSSTPNSGGGMLGPAGGGQ